MPTRETIANVGMAVIAADPTVEFDSIAECGRWFAIGPNPLEAREHSLARREANAIRSRAYRRERNHYVYHPVQYHGCARCERFLQGWRAFTAGLGGYVGL